MANGNLFTKSKEKAVTAKVEKHEIVNIDKTFEFNLIRMIEIDAEMASLESEKSTLDYEVREKAKEEMIKLYDKKGSFPGTIKIVAGSESFLFITSDKYTKIDEEDAKTLSKKYGESIVNETNVFTLNPEMVEKYSKVLSDMILSSKKISNEDKDKLIECKTCWTIAKGTINNLRNAIFAKFNLSNLIKDIRPIFQVKLTK